MNPFDSESTARRYATSRPFFHPIVLDLLRAHLPTGPKLARALDVACGTGHSTRILTEVASEVIGTDPSPGMLAAAFTADPIRYEPAAAEALPFAAGHFALMTVGLALHWFERDRFLAEAHRVLTPGGLLVIYDHGFAGEMACNPAFAQWHATYLRRYPSPPRDKRPLSPAELHAAGFQLLEDHRFTHPWPFTATELADYLVTQSNVIAATESTGESVEAVHRWIQEEAGPCFLARRESFRFNGSVLVLRRAEPSPATENFPCSGHNLTSGLVFFARMLDKIRLHAAGRLPADYNLGGGLDARMCRFLGVAYAEIAARARIEPDDRAVLEWCFTQGRRPSDDEIALFNAYLSKRGWRDEHSARIVERKAKRGMSRRDDLQTTFDLQDVEEGHK
jgi:SAM-dependent methyltransferase